MSLTPLRKNDNIAGVSQNWRKGNADNISARENQCNARRTSGGKRSEESWGTPNRDAGCPVAGRR